MNNKVLKCEVWSVKVWFKVKYCLWRFIEGTPIFLDEKLWKTTNFLAVYDTILWASNTLCYFTSAWGEVVDQQGLNHITCFKNSGWYFRHAEVNDFTKKNILQYRHSRKTRTHGPKTIMIERDHMELQ